MYAPMYIPDINESVGKSVRRQKGQRRIGCGEVVTAKNIYISINYILYLDKFDFRINNKRQCLIVVKSI